MRASGTRAPGVDSGGPTGNDVGSGGGSGHPSDGRSRVLAEARRLFLQHGYADVSMQQIADAAGIKKATIYYHFQDKEDLFAEVVAGEFRALGTRIAAESRDDLPIGEQLERIALVVLGGARADFGRLIREFRDNVSADRRSLGLEAIQSTVELLRGRFERAARTGEIRDVDTDMIVALFMLMIPVMVGGDVPLIANRHRPPAEAAAIIVDVLLNGIGTRRDLGGDQAT